jgi:hypothetical protein
MSIAKSMAAAFGAMGGLFIGMGLLLWMGASCGGCKQETSKAPVSLEKTEQPPTECVGVRGDEYLSSVSSSMEGLEKWINLMKEAAGQQGYLFKILFNYPSGDTRVVIHYIWRPVSAQH